MAQAAMPQGTPVFVATTPQPPAESQGFFSNAWTWATNNKTAAIVIVLLLLVVFYLMLTQLGYIEYFTGESLSTKSAPKKKKGSGRKPSPPRPKSEEVEPDDVDDLIDIINE